MPLAFALVATLSACTPLSLFAGWGGPAPTESASQTPEAAPTPTHSPRPIKTPSGTPTPGCVDRVISTAGVYRIDDCENLTVSGSGIKVTAAQLGTLTIRGDSLQVYAEKVGALDVEGSLNTVQVNNNIDTILVVGDRNMIVCHASVLTVTVNGNDNTIGAEGGVDGEVQNNGQRNQIGAEP
ncbi:MAG: hypothetical protein ABIO06_09310 [Pseudolysinimonas sp.]